MKCSRAVVLLTLLAVACAERDPLLPREDGGPSLADGGADVADAGHRDGGVRRDGGALRDGGSSSDDGGRPDDGGSTGDDGGLAEDGGGLADGGRGDGGSPARDGGLTIPDGGDLPCETGGVTAEVEPNDRPSQAGRLSPGVAVRGKLTPETDEDWYVLNVCGKSLLDITLTMQGPATPPPDAGAPFGTPVDPRVDVIGADGTTLLNFAQNRNGSAGPTSISVVVLAEAAGPVYLRVTDVGSDGKDDSSQYALTVTTAPVPDADREPDGNKGGAISATLAHPLVENVIQTAYLASTRDEDWYKITVPGLRLVDVVVTDSPAVGTPLGYRVRLLGPDTVTELARIEARPPGPTASTNLRLRAQTQGAGDYYAVVSDTGEASDRTRPYRIFYTLGTVPDADVEPNDTPAQARPLTAGTPVVANIATPTDEDWYKVTVTSAEARILRAELTLPVGLRTNVDYRVSIFAPDGLTELSQATDFDGLFGDVDVTSAAYARPSTEPYFVRVTDWRGDDFDLTQPYRLVVTTEPVPDAAQEPNDSSLTATPVTLTPGTPSVKTGYIAYQRDLDFYAVELLAGQSLSASLTAALTPIQYRLSIRDHGGENRIADNYDVNGRMLPNDVSVSAPAPLGTALTAGRYYISVEDLGGDDFDPLVPYTLTITVTGP